MDLADKLAELRGRIERQRGSVSTEEAAKTAFVLPFIQALGYDIFDPGEVIPELTADHGVKKGEKVDYAIKQNDRIVILIECKSVGANLEAKHAGQLFRYFSVTDARFAVLTDGIRYVFYADLEKENRMDERPFFEFDVLSFQDRDVEELKKFAKHSFDLQVILDTAANLKYHKALLAEIAKEFDAPSDDLTRLLATRVYSGRFTSQVKDQFETLVARALKDFVRERINDRLKSALDNGPIGQHTSLDPSTAGDITQDQPEEENSTGIETTADELQSHRIVQAIAAEHVSPERIAIRDAKSYCAILFDNNNRKPICRLYYAKRRMSVGIFLPNGESRTDIEKPADLYSRKADLVTAIHQYLDSPDKEPTNSEPQDIGFAAVD